MSTESTQLTVVVILLPKLNVCWTFVVCFFFFTHAQTIYLLCFVFLEAKGKENFVQHLVLMFSSLAFGFYLQILTNPPHHMNRMKMLRCEGPLFGPQLYAALTSPWAGFWKKDDLCRFASNKKTSWNRKATQTPLSWLTEHYSPCINRFFRYLTQNVTHLKHSLAVL